MIYWKFVGGILLAWLAMMTLSNDWYLFIEEWEIPLTMAFGSFVAGFSAEGGGAVAFPIFTKVLNIAPNEARQFSLLIQSVGMTMASLVIISRKMTYHSFAILPAVAGGALGQIISVSMNLFVSGVHLKWLFSIHIAALGIALFLQHYFNIERREVINKERGRPLLFWTGFIGGFLTINIGCGADMVAFIMLTLILSSTEKKATPTTVIIMALNSVIGVVLISVTGIWSEWAIAAWQTAIPVVIFGAPLGAFLASKVQNQVILYALLGFICIEVISTILIVPLEDWVLPTALTITVVMCGIVGWKYKRQLTLHQITKFNSLNQLMNNE